MMKKLLFTALIAATTSLSFAQTSIINFEPIFGENMDTNKYNLQLGNAGAITFTEDKANDAKGGINPSDHCMEIAEANNSLWWHRGVIVDFGSVDLANGKFITVKFRIMSPATKTSGEINMKLRGSEAEVNMPYSNITIGEWFTLEFDFSAGANGSNWGIEFITDKNVDNTEALVWQIDDIDQHPATTLSTESVKFNSVKLFPNPTTGIVNISGLEEAKSISIFNVIGQRVKTFNNFNSSIDISDLNNGIYLLKSDNGLQRKIVKN